MKKLSWTLAVGVIGLGCADEPSGDLMVQAIDASADTGSSADAPPQAISKNDAAPEPPPPRDAAEPQLNPDAGRPIRVQNVGAACSDTVACDGQMSICMPQLARGSSPLVFAGGYCTALCELSSDCGPSGHCARAEAELALSQTSGASLAQGLPASCMRSCESDQACRTSEGYACLPVRELFPASLQDVVSASIAGSGLASVRYCLPRSTDGVNP